MEGVRRAELRAEILASPHNAVMYDEAEEAAVRRVRAVHRGMFQANEATPLLFRVVTKKK